MEHLLTVPSSEYDGESWRTWLPLAERKAPAIRADAYYPTDRLEPVGVHIGRSGGVYIVECRRSRTARSPTSTTEPSAPREFDSSRRHDPTSVLP